ncbi:hypothetical protein DW081_17170 [Clostridium sp. AF46-9NS]|nr:hypothetical protein DW081_17170 [Clostridium sp. AF46-9NS]RGF31960.1 hypothetical protein DW076_17220 [Clostridium sp. AF46-12NS]
MHCRQAVLHGVLIGLLHLVGADFTGFRNAVAVRIIGVGKAGSLLPVIELFRYQLVTFIVLVFMPFCNRSV